MYSWPSLAVALPLSPNPLHLFVQLFFIDYRVSLRVMRQSVPSNPPGGNFQKLSNPCPPGNVFGLISWERTAKALNSNKFYIFLPLI